MRTEFIPPYRDAPCCIFATSFTGPGSWVRVGTGQPVAPSVDLNVSPDQGYLLVATHGQGLWKIG